jgi:hypothetical protein
MRTRLPLVLSVTALVVAVLGTTGPAVAHGVRHALFAHNADKVDGRHATGFNASLALRKGKLVATSPTTGRVNDAERLDGVDSTAFFGSGLFTGRLNDLNTIGSSAGPVSGVSQAAGSPVGVETLSPNRPIHLRDLAATLTATVPGPDVLQVVLNVFESDGTFITQLRCDIPAGQRECTTAGPAAEVPPRSFLVLQAGGISSGPLPAGTDLLFSWRAQGA